jgi:hypothetical protein
MEHVHHDNGLRRTLCKDLELVKLLPVESVWTVVDGGDDVDQWIMPGIHTVNCICYLISEVPHDWKDIQFRIPSRGYSLTRPGLLRQTNKITRLLSGVRQTTS